MSPITSLYRRLVSWYGSRIVHSVIALIIILAAVGAYMKFSAGDDVVATDTEKARSVQVSPISSLTSNGGSFSILGTVESTREARLVTEAGGRVTSVAVNLGDVVRAGTILARIESSRESAAVLQAQGVYEAALAGKTAGNASIASAERGLAEAETGAVNAYRSAQTTADAVVKNTADKAFSDPFGPYPGLLIDGKGRATEINAERTAIGSMLEAWRTASVSAGSNDRMMLIDTAEKNTQRIAAFLSTLATLYAEDSEAPSQLDGFGSELSAARAQIDGQLAALSGARSSLNAAENALTQARIAGENNSVSASDAQIKQALGSLRLAQANLEKTIIRSPITGTVQSLTLKEGTTVAPGTAAAIVSSEGSLEVVAYVTEDDARMVNVGDEVSIEDVARGVVTEIASAVDPATKKVELRIGIEEGADRLTNGQGVTVSLATSASNDAVVRATTLPIIALKMTPDGAVVFTVENGTLVAHKVTLGAIVGDRVTIVEGVDPSWSIVTDARGLREGETVEVK